MGRRKHNSQEVQQRELPFETREFRYHSGENNKKRKNVLYDPRSEDAFWNDDYDVHSARAREQLRNFAMLSWMIDKHIDFVATFDVEFKTGHDWLDDWLTELLAWWSQAENFDVGRRYSLYQYLRVNEAQRVLNGDMGTLKMADGRVLAVTSEQIDSANVNVNSYGRDTETWFRGVRVHPVTTEATKYRILQRNINDGGLSNKFFDVPASSFYLHADRKHYPNLIRGISPIANSINSIQDCYEGINWHLVKMKIAAMFGVILFESKNALPGQRHNPVTGEVVKTQDQNKPKYDTVKLGDSVASLSMQQGEDIKVLESRIPSTETQAFYEAVTMVALKSLNIPYSFYYEKFTNFYGSRGALIHYIRSCESPRRSNTEFLNHILKWRITKWITDGYIRLPKGYDARQIRWQCVPRGIPLWDPSKETDGVVKAIDAALTTPQNACMEIGTNYYENIEKIKEARDWAAKFGIVPNWKSETAPDVNNTVKGDNDDE